MPRIFEVNMIFDDNGWEREYLTLLQANDAMDAIRKVEHIWENQESPFGTFQYCAYAWEVKNDPKRG